jgi:hypothetical protein
MADIRAYLFKRLLQLTHSIEQQHKEIRMINEMLLEELKSNQPQPLGGLTSQSSSMRRPPPMPTPLREMAPAMREASVEIQRDEEARHMRNASGSYFPAVYGMETAHTIPPQLQEGAARKAPTLSSSKSEANLNATSADRAVHPAHRPAVSGQSRFPNFSKLRTGYKDG